jgi:hypothetical protein
MESHKLSLQLTANCSSGHLQKAKQKMNQDNHKHMSIGRIKRNIITSKQTKQQKLRIISSRRGPLRKSMWQAADCFFFRKVVYSVRGVLPA